jgi:hypothetical protein
LIWSKKLTVIAYLTGHLTQAKVEEVVAQNTTSWGRYEMHVRMDWGYDRPLEATVVALTLPSQSRLAYQHQANGGASKELQLVRRKSPPLGIPLASFENMKKEYQHMVREIVMGDLENYVPVPYDDQVSDLPERLLQIICSFYRAELAADQEVARRFCCDLKYADGSSASFCARPLPST